MIIIKSKLFEQYPGIKFGFSTKTGLDRKPPYYFNMSKSVGDDPAVVEENRKAFAAELGMDIKNVIFQRQIHSDIVNVAGKISDPEGDALVTDVPGIGLAVSSADCAAIFIYDPVKHLIAGIHSGWRGTESGITRKTVKLLREKYGSQPENLIVYVAPSIKKRNYEVGAEVADKFENKYIESYKNGKFLLDIPAVNYNMLREANIPEKNIEVSDLCSFEENDLLHSYRREGARSGRAIGVIMMNVL